MIVTKAAATVETVESENPNGEFDVILSTNALDRDGEHLNPEEWKQPLPEHITFDSDHGMSVDTTVGSGRPFINDQGQLQVRGTFASTPHAQNVRTLVNEGHIRAVSVAFMETKSKGQKDAAPSRELLNGAFVAVPANPEAVVLGSKSLVVEDDMAQALHDAVCQLGAKCSDNVMTTHNTGTSHPEGGEPQESAEESAAESAEPAADAAGSAEEAAEDSADDSVMRARALAVTLRATALSATTTTEEQ